MTWPKVIRLEVLIVDDAASGMGNVGGVQRCWRVTVLGPGGVSGTGAGWRVGDKHGLALEVEGAVFEQLRRMEEDQR